MIFPQSSKRISKLEPMGAEEINDVQERTNKGTDVGGAYTHADAWAIGVDSLCRSDGSAVDEHGHLLPGMHVGTDDGTAFIPMSRIAMRDTNGKIPASMLPGHIDDMIFGTLTVTSSKASFAETPPPGGTPHVYVSPYEEPHSEGEFPPPENIIYCDTSTDIQYRFTGETSTDTDINHFGFTEVPGSRTVNPGYGINITHASDANLTVSAKAPRQLLMVDSNTVSANGLTSTPQNWNNGGIYTYSTLEIRNSQLLETLQNYTSILKLRDPNDSTEASRVWYHVSLDFSIWPNQTTAYIIPIKIIQYTDSEYTVANAKTLQTVMYDMSSNADNVDPDHIHFAFDFSTTATDGSETFSIVGVNGNKVFYKLNRLSVTELL